MRGVEVSTYTVRCDCGYVARGSAEVVVDDALAHASSTHGIELSPDVVWAMAVPARATEPDGPDGER